jgi:hypothetical protein
MTDIGLYIITHTITLVLQRFNLLVTRCINMLNIQYVTLCPHCIYVLCKQQLVPLRAYSGWFL